MIHGATAAHLTLTQKIGVRIPVDQPCRDSITVITGLW